MKIHEFQAKQILREAGVAVPKNLVARTAEEAAKAYRELGGTIAVVKAQIHAGGRGKGNVKDNPAQRGVQLVKSADEAAKVAGNLLGKPLVTIQTGPEGQVVRQVLVEVAGRVHDAGAVHPDPHQERNDLLQVSDRVAEPCEDHG